MLGAGTILREVIAAAEMLSNQFGIAADVYSVTSFTELAREAAAIERGNRVRGSRNHSHVETMLGGDAPVIAATDYVRALPQQIASYIKARYVVLGTDGFGRSASRIALREFFEVDRTHVAFAAMDALWRDGMIDDRQAAKAREILAAQPVSAPPWMA